MLLILPIRTESVIRRTPYVNHALIGVNILIFLFLNVLAAGPEVAAFKGRYLTFHTSFPSLYQFFTYQFLHADFMHLLGNMLFLWVFGNSVNAKMGHFVYLLFYLSGGVFAAWGFAMITSQPAHLLGASGSIAAVTTAYLALFPRSHVTVLVWLFVFIQFIELPAMIMIGLKIIAWDNIIAPRIGGHGAVAHSAHLAGYFFGFVGALGMLLIRALPRDQFDILALWKRWNQRREFAAVMADPTAAARARFGQAARPRPDDPEARAAENHRLDEMADLRARIGQAVDEGAMDRAASLYEELLSADAQQCLSERYQLLLARHLYETGRSEPAAVAFERFIENYPGTLEAGNVKMLLGIIYARDLQRFEAADEYLTGAMEKLHDETRRDQCAAWLRHVRDALGRAAPDIT